MLSLLLLSCAVAQAYAISPLSWEQAYTIANTTVANLTTSEKLGIVHGVGQFSSRCVGDTTAVERLGLPSLCMNDGPAGVRLTNGVTGFPPGINAASTFSRRLMNARGVALGQEYRGKGVNVYLGPTMDLSRNPKGGRNWESFGPDPYLSGEAAYETVTGVQSVGVMACAKHYLANQQEHWRYGLDSIIDDRTTHEMYHYPFLRAIEADVSSVMCAYNRVNGTSTCHNADLIGANGLLRNDGFKGFVVSDWGATHDSATDNANAGLDMEQPGDWILIGGGVYSPGLQSALGDGSVTEETLNGMVSHILAPWYRLGQDSDYPSPNFDVQNPDGSGDLNENVNVRTDATTALVREIAAASTVLLKNNRTDTSRGLPVDASTVKKVAIIGQDAIMPRKDCGSGATYGLNQCNEGTMSIGWGSGSNSLEFIVPPVDAISEVVNGTATVTTSLSNDIDDAKKAAAGQDVCFVLANAMSGELGFYFVVEGNMGDRNDLDLWYKGGSMIEAVASVCSNTIAIVHSVGPVSFSWSEHPNITAIIYAGAPGEQTGPGLADVLFGARNPSGRLPFSIADNEDDYGTEIIYNSDGFPEIEYTEALLLDYRYMDSQGITPRYEFGYGLSYTTFEYADFSVAASGDGQSISFTVANTGDVAGTEIPQLYLGFPEGAGEPPRLLRGFEEVALEAGASSQVEMALTARDLSIWDTVSQSWVRPSGTYKVYVGASINDVRLEGSF
ncbi:glycoside hydrolase family 3 protein [Schizophyllum amplum]|uniref:beta-glucosidase n=1 Tax=Schizophyllum amplum TaxID=97359 RepID=A0A550CRW7_9AGAR|nr:glycoside hydrolase family 3 protein [Auriculariopsis ampla]